MMNPCTPQDIVIWPTLNKKYRLGSSQTISWDQDREVGGYPPPGDSTEKSDSGIIAIATVTFFWRAKKYYATPSGAKVTIIIGKAETKAG